MKANPSKILTAILALLSLFLCIGVMCIFTACQGVKDDGSMMRCYTAQEAICITAAIGTVIYAVAFFMKNMKVRAILAFLSIPLGIATIVFANNMVFLLCMSMDMHCWSMMRPASIAISVAIILVGAVDGLLTWKVAKKSAHEL